MEQSVAASLKTLSWTAITAGLEALGRRPQRYHELLLTSRFCVTRPPGGASLLVKK
jgi:hypothetical protein